MDLPTYRRTQKVTQQQLAERLTAVGYPATQGLISQYESGRTRITPERAQALELITGGLCSRTELVFGAAATDGEARDAEGPNAAPRQEAA